jgi:hypothetical protein
MKMAVPSWSRPAVIALAVAVLIAGIYFFSLKRRVRELNAPVQTDEHAKLELTRPTPAPDKVLTTTAKLYWQSATHANMLEPTTVELPLSNDPVQRAKQLIDELILRAPTSPQRTLPEDAVLLAFYLLPDGTAIADFSDALSSGLPSGIESEQLAVDSILQTLHQGVPQVRQLKILLHGQEADTLAGHLDLSGFFPVPGASAAADAIPPR